jgi:hypothetical protein
MTMLYDHGAGQGLAQAFKAQAQLLYEHADEMQQAGNALVSEYLQGAAAEAFQNSLTMQTTSAKHISETITHHSSAVTSSFGGMHSTDIAGAQSMSL